MKKSSLILFLSCLSIAVNAQKVRYKKDTIYSDGIPYCIMKASSGLAKDFKVYTFSGTEVLRVIYNSTSKEYVATFLPDLEQFVYDFQSLQFGKQLSKSIVDGQLIKGDTLDKNAIPFFKKLYGTPAGSIDYPKNSTDLDAFLSTVSGSSEEQEGSSKLKKRNRNAQISFRGAEIVQDHISIGTCTSKMKAESGNLAYLYQFYTNEGSLIAQARVVSSTAAIVTAKNNRQHELTVSGSNMLSIKEEITHWLIDQLYL